MPINYSAWTKIDVSDDEDETFKHIYTPALFRWRHQSRLEKMAAAKKERDELNRKKEGLRRTVDDVKKLVDDPQLQQKEREKWVAQLEECRKLEKQYEEKEKELKEKEKLQPWNVDTIGRVGFNKTRINLPPSRAPAEAPAEDKNAKLSQFYEKNRVLIRKFSTLTTFDETEEFLLEHPHLCCEETADLLAAECCNLEAMDERVKMEKIARQATVLNYILDLASRLKWPSTSPKLISSAMTKFKKAQSQQADELFRADVRAFADIVIEQMKEKKASLKRKKEADEEEKRKKRLGPGGLDPVQVLKSLPEDMRRCFETKDTDGLRRVAMEMPEEEFNQHFQRCIDSGLWVVNEQQQQNEDRQLTMEAAPTEEDDRKTEDEPSLHTCNDGASASDEAEREE